MAALTGVRLRLSRSARSASTIQVPGEILPCTISSRISWNAVSRLVPCSGLSRFFPGVMDLGRLWAAGASFGLTCFLFNEVHRHQFYRRQGSWVEHSVENANRYTTTNGMPIANW